MLVCVCVHICPYTHGSQRVKYECSYSTVMASESCNLPQGSLLIGYHFTTTIVDKHA